jgi:uncharacterized membrane protein YoaK (UPF0700 family)
MSPGVIPIRRHNRPLPQTVRVSLRSWPDAAHFQHCTGRCRQLPRLGRVFVANMTGNMVLLGFAAAGVSGLSIIRALLSRAGFLVGAALGGKLGTMVASGRRRRLIIVAGTFEAFLISAAAVASIGFDLRASASVEQLYAMIV